ncbi:MAG: zinc ribbon domain-containing protein, partial [Chloroflexi bacterium]|nr:zinc ribbon domain-containing protein [Chloroflexota bacterium]
RMRCPHCDTLGFPDDTLRNLLPLGWTCQTCGEPNEGLTTFCTACGTGLPSRCLRCESAVATTVCLSCGTHQERYMRFQQAHERRQIWTPLLPEAQTAKQIADQPAALADNSQQTALPALVAPNRFAIAAGFVALTIGILALIGVLEPSILAGAASELSRIGTWVGTELLPGLSAVFNGLVSNTGDLTQNDPEYALLFVVVVFGAALLPLLLFVLRQLLGRLFS